MKMSKPERQYRRRKKLIRNQRITGIFTLILWVLAAVIMIFPSEETGIFQYKGELLGFASFALMVYLYLCLFRLIQRIAYGKFDAENIPGAEDASEGFRSGGGEKIISRSTVSDSIVIEEFAVDMDLVDVGDKFSGGELPSIFKDGITYFLKRRKYDVSDRKVNESTVTIGGEILKADIGNRFLQYMTAGLMGKGSIELDVKIRKADELLYETTIVQEAGSGYWLLSNKKVMTNAAYLCGRTVSRIFQK